MAVHQGRVFAKGQNVDELEKPDFFAQGTLEGANLGDAGIVAAMRRKNVKQHLFADAGYRRAESLRVIEAHGHIARVVDRRKEIGIKRRHPTKKARC